MVKHEKLGVQKFCNSLAASLKIFKIVIKSGDYTVKQLNFVGNLILRMSKFCKLNFMHIVNFTLTASNSIFFILTRLSDCQNINCLPFCKIKDPAKSFTAFKHGPIESITPRMHGFNLQMLS